MPLARYKIRSEYSLADPELHRAADKDDPEALLEAIAMAGLVGVLRQLGDLAEFAAEIFHDLHEEVMATSARGHRLMARVQQIEAEFPSIEKPFLSQTNHSSFFFNAGIDWHPNLQCEQNVVTHGDLPRFVMDSYEECRGPPRLFLLDKFDVAGAGACLKRYTDPSSIKMEAASSGIARSKVHRETRIYKVKQKKGTHRRDGETPEVGAHTKLHQLLLEERLENAYTDPGRLMKLKKRQLNGFAIEAKTGRSYMKKFLESPSPDHKIVCETSMIPLHLKLTSDDTSEAGVRILEIGTFSPVKRTIGHESTYSSPNEQELGLRPFLDMDGDAHGDLVKVLVERPPGVMDEMPANHLEEYETELAKDGQKKIEGSIDRYHPDDVASEVDNHLDAVTGMDSEMDTYNEYRLKKCNFLNVHRTTDADGKEEHQLQARFSDCQSFGDSSMSDKNSSSKRYKNEDHAEKQAHFSDSESIETYSTSDENSSFKRDRNEGLMELQAQLSDSQPIGISHVSEKTSSPKRDRNPECMELEAHFPDSQSIGNSISDEISSIRKDRTYSSHNDSLGPVFEDIELESHGCNTPGLLSYIKNSLVKPDGGKFVRKGNGYVKEEELPDSGQASSTSYLLNSGHMSLGSDVETIKSEARSTGTQFQEKPSDSIENYSKSSDDEDRKYVVEPVAPVPDALSQMEEDACPVVSSENVHVRMVGDAASYVVSNALLQVSNVLESTSEHQRHIHWKINMFPDEARNGSLVECSSYPSMAVDLSLCPMLPPNCLDSKSEDVFKATQLSIKDLSTVVETPMASDFEGEQFSDLAYGSPQDEPGSERVKVLYHDQQAHLQEISRMVHCDEIKASIYSVDAVEDNCHLEHPSSSDYGRQNNHIMLCDVVTEEADSEDQAVSVVPSAVNIENNANVMYTASGLRSSTNLASPQEMYLGSSESYQMQMESDEIESIETFTDLEAGRRDNQLEQSSDLTPSNIISSPMWDLRDSQQFLSDSVDIHGKENRVIEAVASESLSELKAQVVVDQCEVASTNIISAPMQNLTNSEESLSNYMDHHQKEVEADEGIAEESLAEPDEPKFADQLKVASADVKPSLKTCGSSEPTESETCIIIEDSSLLNQILQHSVIDATTGPKFSGIDVRESESKSLIQNGPLQGGKDDKSLASYNHLGSEISSEQFLQSRVGQKDAEFVLINEEKYNPENLQSTQNELEEEGSSHATSESAPDIHPDQPSSWKLLSESAGQEINPIKHDINPLKPFLSAYHPKLAHINLEDTPPMPPLPPVQWRMNKVQNTSLASQRELEVSQTSFLPIQPIKTDETTRFSLSGSEQTWQYQNPYLPVMAVEGDRLQHTSGFSMGFPGHPVSIPLQFPVVFNEPNSPYNYLYLDRSSQYLQSPVVSFPVISTVRPPHSDQFASEGEVAQCSSPGTPLLSVENAFEHDSVQEKVNQPSSQRAADTNSVQEKETQASSQMVADANSESEVLRQSSSNLQGEQGGPFISSVSPPSLETVLPNVNTLPSDGEMALSSDTSNQTSGFEGEMPNGKPHNKLPRPRSPLVDAVAAHDKSKLRKVIERVRPRMAPKEDEKDSFLEQIRAKSFNLKPASVKRPNIQGPKTNLNVAAILEKANAIRQAFAGSDEDDDADSWSDS